MELQLVMVCAEVPLVTLPAPGLPAASTTGVPWGSVSLSVFLSTGSHCLLVTYRRVVLSFLNLLRKALPSVNPFTYCGEQQR